MRVEFVRRLAVVGTVSLIVLSLVLAVDWLVELPLQVRTGMAVCLGGVAALLLLWALMALVTQRRDEETLALMVEEREPGFQSRLIASVQFARGKATVPGVEACRMVEEMVGETESFARTLRLTSVVNTSPLKRALWLVLILGGIAGGGYFFGGSIPQVLLRRAFLSDEPVPRATRVAWITGSQKIGVGDSMTIEAVVEGHCPREGSLRLRYESGRRLRVAMERGSDENRYRATLQDVRESFSFQAVIRDGKSSRESVVVLPRPTVDEVIGQQIYPDYMKLPSSGHRPGEFLLYSGSSLALRITASHPLSKATLRLLGGGESTLPAAVATENPRVAEVRLDVTEKLSGFTVDLEDATGMASNDTTVYRVDVLTDEPPTVRLLNPLRQQQLVTAGARVLIGYEAEDSFGVEKVVLKYRVVSQDEEASVELPVRERGRTMISEVFDWELEGLEPPVKVGDEIEFWIEADDQNERTPMGKSVVKALKVVTSREKRNDLLSQVGDSLGRIGRATDDQERLNTALSEWIRAQRHLPEDRARTGKEDLERQPE